MGRELAPRWRQIDTHIIVCDICGYEEELDPQPDSKLDRTIPDKRWVAMSFRRNDLLWCSWVCALAGVKKQMVREAEDKGAKPGAV